MVDRATLIERTDGGLLSRPQRPAFDVITLVHAGTGAHMVDFEVIPLAPARMVRVVAGQVQSWDLDADIEATIILSRVADGAAGFARPSGACNLSRDSYTTAVALVEALDREQRRFDGDPRTFDLMAALGVSLDAIFERGLPDRRDRHHPAYVEFCASIDRGIGWSHNVGDHARAIGFSERTITRACQRATGLTAKGVLDQRIVLEAKRLMAHTDRTAASIATELGFSEATNFTKFFRRQTGERPTDFRRRHPVG